MKAPSFESEPQNKSTRAKILACGMRLSPLLALGACAPYPGTHGKPNAGPETHVSGKGKHHPSYFGHLPSHPYWNLPHTHEGPLMMDDTIKLLDTNNKVAGVVKNPYPTQPNYPKAYPQGQPSNSIPQAQPVEEPSPIESGVHPEINTDGTYTVQSGDTAGDIAQKFNLPYGRLKELNPQIEDLGNIQAGQKIRVK